MAFTPKFVDLVRNYTLVQGTGPVSTTGPVSGYTSLSEALSTGDQFYYCIQGVDKPGEREVGRGTVQSNGTILRDPIGGTPTNFTKGSKTISLVTAAEWFSKVEGLGAGGAAGGGDVARVASRTALAAIAATSGMARVLGEAGREGLFLFTSGNLSARVAADPQQGLFIAPASQPSGASGAWVRSYSGALDARWFGAKADDPAAAAANLVAITAACEYRHEPASDYTSVVDLGPGKWHISATLEPQAVFHLRGHGSGLYSGARPGISATRLIAPASTTVIRVNTGSFALGGADPAGKNASGSIIEGLSIEQAALGPETDRHGIHMRATAIVRDCIIHTIAGDGIAIIGSSGGSGADYGGPNCWRVINCQIENVRGNGLRTEGSDANAGYSLGLDVRPGAGNLIGGCGILDSSWLPNAHYGVHIAQHGNGGVSHNGRIWQLVTPSLTLGGATEPGTNSLIWYDLGTYPPSASFPPWTSGATYRPMLPALITNGSPIDGYEEHLVTRPHCNGPVRGNLRGTDYTPRQQQPSHNSTAWPVAVGQFRSTGGEGVNHPAYPVIGDQEYTFIGHRGAGDGHAGGGQGDVFKRGNPLLHRCKDQFLKLGYIGDSVDQELRYGGRQALSLTGTGTAEKFGRSSGVDGMVVLHKYVLTDDYCANGRIHWGSTSGPPTTGQHVQGDFCWNNYNPGDSNIIGWSCSVSGSPGSWKPVKFAPLQYQEQALGQLFDTRFGPPAHTVRIAEYSGDIYIQAGTDDGSAVRKMLIGGYYGTNAPAVLFRTEKLGFASGTGGTVTQTASKATAVTLNKPCGRVTMNGAELGAGAVVSFALNNDKIGPDDVVQLCIAGGATAGAYQASVDEVVTGSCRVSLRNLSAAALSEAVVLNVAVIAATAA